tara:strand:+ start:263 stop:397 length:135 start_codon:yes stop_codon:yes gene_type:complete
MVERLDILNVFEVQKIRELLIHNPDLLSLFEVLIIIINDRLNKE